MEDFRMAPILVPSVVQRRASFVVFWFTEQWQYMFSSRRRLLILFVFLSQSPPIELEPTHPAMHFRTFYFRRQMLQSISDDLMFPSNYR
jgi:hypothetical protein